MNEVCNKCGASLSSDEIAVYKKLVNRGAKSYLCIKCLAAHFEISEDIIHAKIKQFKEMHCTLFSN